MVFPGVRLCLRASFAGVGRSRVAVLWTRSRRHEIFSVNLAEPRKSHASGIVSIRPPLVIDRPRRSLPEGKAARQEKPCQIANQTSHQVFLITIALAKQTSPKF